MKKEFKEILEATELNTQGMDPFVMDGIESGFYEAAEGIYKLKEALMQVKDKSFDKEKALWKKIDQLVQKSKIGGSF